MKKRLIALVLGGFISALLMAEVAMRFNRHLYSAGYVASRNPRLLYELEDSLAPRYEEKKPDGVFRIAVVSDSVGYGFRVPRSATYSNQLEAILNERLGRRFEVINFSVPGYNTAQELEVIRAKALPANPDLIILGFTDNDTSMCNFFWPVITWRNWIFHRSHLAHYALRTVDAYLMHQSRDTITRWQRFRREELGEFSAEWLVYVTPGLEEISFAPEHGKAPQRPENVPARYHYMIGDTNYRIHLREIEKETRTHGVPLLSTGFLSGPAVPGNEELRRTYGLHVLNYSLALDHWSETRNIPKQRLFIPNDGHPTVLGHRGLAEEIAEYLIREGMVAPRARSAAYSESRGAVMR